MARHDCRMRRVYLLRHAKSSWADTQAGVQKIRWLAEHAVPTIHLSIGIAPLSGGRRPAVRRHRGPPQ
jgi:hypothetical protein